MGGFVEAILIGATVGAGTAAATGGDPGKGAIFGAAGGAIGGIAGPATQVSGVKAGAVAGGAIGGAASSLAVRTRTPAGVPRPSALSPAPTTVMAAERAEVDRGLKRKRQAASVMGGDYGALNVQQNKLGT